MNIHTYLNRIGYHRPCTVDVACLEALTRAHLFSVPFENLDIHLNIPINLDYERIYRKVVQQRRGGFCYELNGIFGALLREVGFEVEYLSAQILRDDEPGVDFDHMALRVTVGDRQFLVDVGYGDGSRGPLELTDGASRAELGRSYRLRKVEAGFRYEVTTREGERKGYLLSLVSHPARHFEARCSHHQTSPQSWFTRNRVCVLPTPSGCTTIIGGELRIQEGDAKPVTRSISEASDYLEILNDRFNLHVIGMPRIKARSLALRLRRQGEIWQHRVDKLRSFALSRLTSYSSSKPYTELAK